MAAKKEKNSLENYYVIKFEKYIDLIVEVESKYNVVSDYLHDEILKRLPDYWDESPVPYLAQTFSCIFDIRTFLDEKVNNPPESEIKLANDNNIKDVLITKQELNMLNSLLLTLQELEADLEINYKISLNTH